MKMTIIVSSDERLDTFFKAFKYNTRSEFSNLIKKGKVLINDKKVKAGYKIKCGDVIFVPDEFDYNEPKNLNIPIIYEDDYIIVINKPSKIATHGAKSYKGDSVVNWLLYYGSPLSNFNGEDRPGIVHRLDADTSGALIIAKNNKVHKILQEEFKNRKIVKEYLAIVNGSPNFDQFIIDEPIARSKNPIKMAVVNGGRKALSIVSTVAKNDDFAFLNINIKTGRTHQIRVHLSHKNLPIIGDKIYGNKKEKITASRQMLHAYHLKFNHPITNKTIELYADIPEDFTEVLKKTALYER